MSSFFFLIKTCLLTFTFVLFLQLKINQKTLEHYSTQWIKHSTLTQPIQAFAQNGILVVKKYLDQTTEKIRFKLFKPPTEYPMGDRLKKLKLKRSQIAIENMKAIQKEQSQAPPKALNLKNQNSLTTTASKDKNPTPPQPNPQSKNKNSLIDLKNKNSTKKLKEARVLNKSP